MREKYRDASDAVRDLESKISDIDKRIAADYGPDMRFEALSRECIEFTPGGEWNYEICPFRDAKQKGKDGYPSTSIGTWEGFEEGGYGVMKFTNGQSCWNGPMRSLTVTLSCAEANKILSVDEPEVCKYAMRFQTPAACTAEHATEAQADLNALSGGSGHDEL